MQGVSGSPLFGSALLLSLPSVWEFIELCFRGLQYVTENLLGKVLGLLGLGTPAQAQTLAPVMKFRFGSFRLNSAQVVAITMVHAS